MQIKKFLLYKLAESEKFLKLDLMYFATGSFWAIIQQIIGVSSGLFISYLFGHFVSKTVFGQYNLILSLLGMLNFVSLSGIDKPLTGSIGKGYDGSFVQSRNLKFKYSLIGIPLLLVFAGYYFMQNQNIVASGLIISALFFPFYNSFTNFPALLTAKKLFFTLSALASISSLFFLLVMTISIFLFPSTVGIITGYLLGLTVPSIFSFYFSKRYIHNSKKDIHLPSYGLFLTVLSILPWVSANLGNVLLAHYLGVETLAIYSVASRFLTAVQKNFIVFYKPITSKLAGQTPKQNVITLKQHSIKLFAIGIGLAVGLWIMTPPLITFFFTDKYTDAIFYAQILSLALIPLPLNWVLNDMVIYQKHKAPQVVSAFFLPIIKIILFVTIIPSWGISGLVSIILLERFTEPLIPLFYVVKDIALKRDM